MRGNSLWRKALLPNTTPRRFTAARCWSVKVAFHLYSADERNRTSTGFYSHKNLNLARLPVPPHPREAGHGSTSLRCRQPAAMRRIREPTHARRRSRSGLSLWPQRFSHMTAPWTDSGASPCPQQCPWRPRARGNGAPSPPTGRHPPAARRLCRLHRSDTGQPTPKLGTMTRSRRSDMESTSYGP